jgi:putative peptidoglycan lipid II flippase
MSIVSNGIILVYYFFLFERLGEYAVYGLCLAFLVGWVAQAVIQMPFLKKNDFDFRIRFAVRDPALKQIALLTLPVMAASWIGPVNLLVNGKAVNMYGGVYDYTAIHFAYVLFSIVSGVFVLSVANVIFPELSRKAANHDTVGYQDTLRDTLRSLFFFLLPMTFGLMAVSTALIRFLYYGGLFTETAVETTGNALFFFALGTVGYGVQIVLSRACYARQDGRTPMLAALLAIVLNLGLSLLLAKPMGASGVALASSVSISVSAALMFVLYYRKGYMIVTTEWQTAIVKMLVLSVVMGFGVYFALPYLHVLIISLIGAVFYFVGARLWGLNEMKNIKRFFKNM